ncbi:MAG: glycoside hydrolase family 6 protein [Mycobacteriales bacterium]
MTRTRLGKTLITGAVAATAMLATSPAQAVIPDGTQFYVGKPNHGAVAQIAALTAAGRKTEAAQIRSIIKTPTAIWVESGSPKEAEQQVRQITLQATDKGTVPVLVLYNIPFRDCAQYSAGGATTMAEYNAWIDGIVRGIGNRKAVIAVEPDGLGIIPFYVSLDEQTKTDPQTEWCRPADADPATAANERFAMLNHAVDGLTALPNTSVYLDGTHNGWLNVGDVSQRLVRAGVDKADGFFLNASNYNYTSNLVSYGTWVSSCIEWATDLGGSFAGCPNQYWNGGPSTGWNGTALDPYGVWTEGNATLSLNTQGLNERYAGMLNGATLEEHFIIDTSRNGQGPWAPTTADFVMPTPSPTPGDLENWCNPPHRGIGLLPTTQTGNDLVDAYVWIKVPGESDGSCRRGYGDLLGGVDPAWGIVDPGAGQWFDAQALELAALANPPLTTTK